MLSNPSQQYSFCKIDQIKIWFTFLLGSCHIMSNLTDWFFNKRKKGIWWVIDYCCFNKLTSPLGKLCQIIGPEKSQSLPAKPPTLSKVLFVSIWLFIKSNSNNILNQIDKIKKNENIPIPSFAQVSYGDRWHAYVI